MTRVDVAIHDIAQVLCSVPDNLPNRQQVFETALASLIRFALSEHQLTRIRRSDHDLTLAADIQSVAARTSMS